MKKKIKKKHILKSNQLASQALTFQQSGNIVEAINYYQKALNINPYEIPALHNLAILFFRQNQFNEGEKLLVRLLKNEPDNELANETIGHYYFEHGDPIKAEHHLKLAILKNPKNIKACHIMAMSLASRGQYDDAEDYFQKILSINSNYDKALCNYAKLQYIRNEYEKAEELLNQVLSDNKYHIEAITLLADLYIKTKKFNEVESVLEGQLKHNSNSPELLSRLANVYAEQEKFDLAIETYQRAIDSNPSYEEAYNLLGVCYANSGNYEKAIDIFSFLIKKNESNLHAYANLANNYKNLGELDNAITYMRRAIEIDKKNQENSLINEFLYNDNEYLENVSQDAKNLAIPTDTANIHSTLATYLLMQGLYEEGWIEYQWRFNTNDVTWTEYDCPLWQGENLDNKVLLIWHEQGFGDSIQFIRFVNIIKKGTGKIILSTQNKLHSLFNTIECIDQIIETYDPEIQPDYHFPIGSLPVLMQDNFTTLSDTIPYLGYDADRKIYWQNKINNKNNLKIGIVWAGNPEYKADRLRSPGFDVVSPLLDIPNITFYSLQRGKGKSDLSDNPNSQKLIDYTDEIPDFYDDAAFMQNMDIIITSDTATVHLAGALGLNTWCLLAYSPDWRWELGTATSSWYPNVRLFRQKKLMDWSNVIADIKTELIKLL